MEEKIKLKSISELLELNFFIPHYQRGYRWTEQQVKDLLNDIDNFSPKSIPGTEDKTFYCLQPVVVKECNEEIKRENDLSGQWFEVIDGQQRLTTIYLLIHYANEMWVGKQKNPEFDIRYETRKKSTEFLQKLKVDDELNKVMIDKSNIDFYHISKAYDTIHNWVTGYKGFDNNEFQSKLKSYAKVIWYKVDITEKETKKEINNSIKLFTRLNIGKIPLTNAELIKALFLSSSSFDKENSEDAIRKKMEISQMWDEIEQKLNEEDGYFWAFVTNEKREEYPTKIELLFDMISKKKRDQIDTMFTFLHFLNKSKDTTKPLWDLWLSIEQYYLTLCEWYRKKNLYHKIGYLVAIGEQISDLIELSLNQKKDMFENVLDDKIKKSVDFDIESLTYEKKSEYYKIEKVLLLFNVESVRANDSIAEFYPFKFHKNVSWSLEHIHAQNSESLDENKREQWSTWLRYHKELIEELIADNIQMENKEELKRLLSEINLYDNKDLKWEKFSTLADEVIAVFSEKSEDLSNEMHSISNLALLSHSDNAALNNAVFEVKRREIIRMDKKGSYIPLCTRRAFLKYYNDRPSTQQYYFWGKDDRDNYLNEIKNVLKDYLPEEELID